MRTGVLIGARTPTHALTGPMLSGPSHRMHVSHVSRCYASTLIAVLCAGISDLFSGILGLGSILDPVSRIAQLDAAPYTHHTHTHTPRAVLVAWPRGEVDGVLTCACNPMLGLTPVSSEMLPIGTCLCTVCCAGLESGFFLSFFLSFFLFLAVNQLSQGPAC